MTFRLRRAEEADVPALAAIYRESVEALGPPAYAAEQVAVWAAFASDPAFGRRVVSGRAWIAEAEGRPAAFAVLDPGDHLSLLYCSSRYARLGAGGMLVDAASAEAAALGAAVLHLEASRVGRPFFERKGFRVLEREEVERGGVRFERFRMARLLFAPAARRWAVLGNSGSGKSTLARRIAALTGAGMLDLDTIAWREDRPVPERRPIAESAAAIDRFTAAHASWVMEGCYEDLIALGLQRGAACVFLDVPPETCAARVRERAFEPRKYASPEAQRAATEALVAWILEYPARSGAMSRSAHAALFAAAPEPKLRVPEF